MYVDSFKRIWTICTVHAGQIAQCMNSIILYAVHGQFVQYMDSLYSQWTAGTT